MLGTSETPDPISTESASRVKTLTEKSSAMYESTQSTHRVKLEKAWINVEFCLNVSEKRPTNLVIVHQAHQSLNESHRQYQAIAQAYHDFLTRTNTIDSLKDLDSFNSVTKAHERLVKHTIAQLNNDMQQFLETTSQVSAISKAKSHHSKSSRLSVVSSILAKKKAEAEVARARVEFAFKEADFRKQQAVLEVDLDLLKTQRHAAETAAEFNALQTMSEIDENISDNVLNTVPFEDPGERTKRYVEDYSILPVLDTVAKQTIKTEPTTQNNFQQTNRAYDPISQSVPQSHRNRTLNPDAQSYHPFMSQYNQTFQPNTIATDLTQYLLKKELLTTRFSKFNDQPESYASWKAGFLSIVRDLNITPVEELDLLVKWLGPDSSKHAVSLKTSNVSNPERGLQRIWDRLDERFGSPELVESALKAKLERFSKLTNTDNKQLYELSDILSEIESVKEDANYTTLLAYFDSSSGVIPIVNKLAYGLQEKWTTQATNYKRRHKVLFPPFSYFVEFMREVSRTRNDHSFAYKSTASVPQKRPPAKQTNFRINVSSKKTDVFPQQVERGSETIQSCPIYKTNYSLNQCRGFRMRTLDDCKKLLKEHGICFKCCASTTHMARTCKSTAKCAECGSTQHATALHIGRITAVKQSSAPEANVGGENSAPPTVTSKCTQICGTEFGGKSCSKNILVNIYPNGSPHKARRVYAILDEQSNVSLARSKLFDHFGEHSDSMSYTLSSCSGRIQTAGRRAKDYIVEALDGSGQVNLPVLIECNQIPNIREEIPTPEVAECHSHLEDIANLIPPLDDDSQILLLIGRDVPTAHHVLNQRIGPQNSPYAQRLLLGWVIVGETCLGNAHKSVSINVNKTNILSNGRPSLFTPCTNKLEVKDRQVISDTTWLPTDSDIGSTVFAVTKDDNKPGASVEDREFLRSMDKENDQGSGWELDSTACIPYSASASSK